MEGKKFKVTAVIHKAGNLPVKWEFYSDTELTKKQCEMRFYKPKEAGRSSGEHVRIEKFSCTRVR